MSLNPFVEMDLHAYLLIIFYKSNTNSEMLFHFTDIFLIN